MDDAGVGDNWLGSLCPQCGFDCGVNEEGCCTSCGCDAVGQGCDEAISRIEKLESSLDAERKRVQQLETGLQAERTRREAAENVCWTADAFILGTTLLPGVRVGPSEVAWDDMVRGLYAWHRSAQRAKEGENG